MDMSRLGFILSGMVFALAGGGLIIIIYIFGLALFGVDSAVARLKRVIKGGQRNGN